MRILKVILSVLIIIFSVAFGAFLGVTKYQQKISAESEKPEEKFIVYPLPQIISPKSGIEVSGKQNVLVAAPGAKALYLSGKNESGETLNEGEAEIVSGLGEFEWDTTSYKDDSYNVYVTAYYQTGAPSKVGISLDVKNSDKSGIIGEELKSSSNTAYQSDKIDSDSALTRNEDQTKKELNALEIDQNLLIEKLEVIQSDDKFKVTISGLAKDYQKININTFSSHKKKEVSIDPNGAFKTEIVLSVGRHEIYADSGGKRSPVAEVYLSSQTSQKPLAMVNDLKKEVITYGSYTGGPAILLVLFGLFLPLAKQAKPCSDNAKELNLKHGREERSTGSARKNK